MNVVLDASVALAWLFQREHPAEADHADKVLASLRERDAVVPALWHAEIVNVLVTANRRGMLTVSQAAAYLSSLGRLPIHTDPAPVGVRNDQIFSLAREYALSAYDATYLDLALQTGIGLVTFDRRLAQARDAAGVYCW